ncbi:MAG TPA: glycosyltransferase family 1 protein [bacterium]|nr:glycosyltransferase family 1 protein [bacterium]
MRIAIVTETYAPDLNGVARTLVALVGELRRLGHEVSLVRPTPRGTDVPRESGEVRVTGMAIPGYSAMQFGFPAGGMLRELWNKERPDVVHIDTEGPLGYSALNAARALNLPVTSSLHTHFHVYMRHYGLPWLGAPALAYLRHFHNSTAFTLIPTEDQREQLAADGLQKLKVLGRGVDADLFHPKRRNPALRAEWGVADDAPVALYVGRLAAEKNLQLFIRSVHAMREVQPSLRAVVVGSGPLEHDLRRDHPDMIFSGARVGEDLAEHYASADCFVFPSLSETFGNVLLEAMASGLAPLAFDYAAARHLFVDAENGLVARVGDEQHFIEQAKRLASSPEWAQTLGVAARQRAETQTWSMIAQQLEAMWREITPEKDSKTHLTSQVSGQTSSKTQASPPMQEVA